VAPGSTGRGTSVAVGSLTCPQPPQPRDTTWYSVVRGRIAHAPVVHFDETGFRVEGRLHWVHSVSTGKYSLITVHRRRGTKGMDHLPARDAGHDRDVGGKYTKVTLGNAHVPIVQAEPTLDDLGHDPPCRPFAESLRIILILFRCIKSDSSIRYNDPIVQEGQGVWE
jgi:hypothetical protein